jgi:mono/diheme cytochrome c family protein
VQQNGLVLDLIAPPEENPWKRRVRAADLAFLDDDRAAVVTYDGDVWLLDGLAAAGFDQLAWRRFASGLHEPLAIAAPQGVIQVATKNGVVRLHDRDGNGEAYWFENFNDQLLQSYSTRAFPLDMAIGPDGSTFVTQGGIGRPRLESGAYESPQPAAILKISPDGRSSQIFATGAREAYVAVHPRTGLVTATDQQGPFIPSSLCYLVRPGDEYGFNIENPDLLALPLVWIPHEQDNSSSSEVWMLGAGMGPWNGRLLHLSYGNGRLLLIAPDLEAPQPQGAVIPLDFKTDLPLLHARLHPRGDAVFLAGFQIYDSQVSTPWALGRLRPGETPITTPVAARSCAEGVVLEFTAPLDPDSILPEKVVARAWNYLRSSAYGSGRYALDGKAGTTPWPVGQTVLSTDRKSVFIHLPELPPVMQLEIRHEFRLAGGAVARGAVYFTIHQPHRLDLARAGFPGVDLSRSVAVVAPANEPPATAALGRELAQSIGCAACHSVDGTTEGKNGPTWRGLFGARRTFVDGTSEIADELYLREKILDPQRKKMKSAQVEMPSYRGVLSEPQVEALVLYIKSLRTRTRSPKGPAP